MDTTKINIKYIFCFPADVWVFNKHELTFIGGKDIVHYGNVTVGAIASQITSITIVYSTVYSDADQRKHQSSASLAFVWGIHRGPVNSPHKWPVTRKMFPFDDVIMWKPSVFGVSSNPFGRLPTLRTESAHHHHISQLYFVIFDKVHAELTARHKHSYTIRYNVSQEKIIYQSKIFAMDNVKMHMGRVTELWLSCYLVLLSIDSKTR